MSAAEGVPCLRLQNLCHGISEPAILDAKLGFKTTYPWANDKHFSKNRRVSRLFTGACLAHSFVCRPLLR